MSGVCEQMLSSKAVPDLDIVAYRGNVSAPVAIALLLAMKKDSRRKDTPMVRHWYAVVGVA